MTESPTGYPQFDETEQMRSWMEIDAESILHQWSSNSSYQQQFVVRAEGNYFWTADGDRFLDFTSQAFFANIGHCDSRVIEAMTDQARLLSGVMSRGTPVKSKLAARLIELLPEYDRIYFGTNGSDAVEIALKTARAMTGRQRVLSFFGSYHGTTAAASAVSGEDRTRLGGGEPVSGSVFVPPPYHYRSMLAGTNQEETDSNTVAYIRETIEEVKPETIAAFIAEPCLTAGAGVVPGPGFWRAMKELCDEYGIILIADEIITGFGRTGSWFAHQQHDYSPDLIVMAKGLSSGYAPISATVFSPKAAAHYDDTEVLFGLTHSGHPLGCAAALAVIDIFDQDDLIYLASTMGVYLAEALEGLMRTHPSLGDIRQAGLFATLELVRDPATKSTFPSSDSVPGLPPGEPGAGKAIGRHLAQSGISVRPTAHLIKLGPPLTITRDEVDLVIDVLDKGLAILDEHCV